MINLTGHSIPQTDPPRPPREVLPSMYDLPSEFPEEPGLPDEYHDLQPQLLSRTLSLTDYSRDSWFTGSDLNLYYDARHPLWHKRPDWFLAVNVPRLYEGGEWRRSYVVWQEGQSPRIVIEFLSPKTEREDLGRFYQESDRIPDPQSAVGQTVIPKTPNKLEVYEQYLRVPHYLVYSRYTEGLRYFKLIGGQYEEQPLHPENPFVWMADLNLGLGLWQGIFEGVTGSWLRWCDQAGIWFLTDTEKAEQQAEIERLAKEEAQLKAERLAQRLRELGVDPEDL
ncbi:MAG: Uma2 family endonuclease [Synechococcaceae cyanobacterium SM2_3_1]|nr:Uma2 family endonuclease [Synechococcaceae cyanobacterium SM2_3_1]